MASHLPWIEKYRPKNLTELVSQKNVIETLNNFIDSGQLPHLLFYGAPGTGKTSAILACAKRIYGSHSQFMVLELNASDQRGINHIREQVKDFSDTQNFFSTGIKLVILDEADNMTKEAQAALRRVVEKYTKNVRFCLICNYISKIIPALQSRCTKFRFSPLKDSEIIERIKEIVIKENVSITRNGLRAILKIGCGDMRKILNIIESASLTHNPIKEKHIFMITGKPSPSDIDIIFNSLMNETLDNNIQTLQKIQKDNGLDLLDIVFEIHQRVLYCEEIPQKSLLFIFKELASLENILTRSSGSDIQMGCLISIFQIARSKF